MANDATKTAEREAFQVWANRVLDPEVAKTADCSMLWMAWQASADAALERAAEVAQTYWREPHSHFGREIADTILALKGSR